MGLSEQARIRIDHAVVAGLRTGKPNAVFPGPRPDVGGQRGPVAWRSGSASPKLNPSRGWR